MNIWTELVKNLTQEQRQGLSAALSEVERDDIHRHSSIT